MEFWAMVQLYTIVAAALAGTSYFTLYRPAIILTEEIIDEDLPGHKGWLGGSLWLIFATIFAPLTLFILLKNNNKDFITAFAVKLSEDFIEREE